MIVPSEFDDEVALESIRAVEHAGNAGRVLGESQELLDHIFSPFSGVPVHSDVSNNVDELTKVLKGQSSTGAVQPKTEPTRRVAPKVTITDPLEKLMHENDPIGLDLLPNDHLCKSGRFSKVVGIVDDFLARPEIRKRIGNHKCETVKEAEARVIMSALEFIDRSCEDAREGII